MVCHVIYDILAMTRDCFLSVFALLSAAVVVVATKIAIGNEDRGIVIISTIVSVEEGMRSERKKERKKNVYY